MVNAVCVRFKTHICQQMSTQSETSAPLDMTRTQPKDYHLGGGRVVLCQKKENEKFFCLCSFTHTGYCKGKSRF